jgi:predicted Zn-dependent protease
VARFEAGTSENAVGGVVGFIEYLGDVYEIIGYSLASRLGDHEATFERTIWSFDRLSDESALNVEPRRISLVRIEAPMSLQEFANRYGGSADIGTLSLINGVPPGANLPAGTWKRVVGKVSVTP